MVKACLGNKIERLFFSSSACIYPTHKQTSSTINSLKESDAYPAYPNEFYGWEKLYTELLMEAFSKDFGLDIRIARYHNIYGPSGTYDGGREKAPAALCRKIVQAEDGGEIEIWGDGEQSRSFCYIDDCLEGTIKLMESDHNKPLNIGADTLITINDLADMIIKISGKKINKRYNKSFPEGVRGRNSDNTNLENVLGWKPEISLEQGLGKTYKWIKRQIKI